METSRMERESTGLYMMSHRSQSHTNQVGIALSAFLRLLAFAVWLYVYRAQVELCETCPMLFRCQGPYIAALHLPCHSVPQRWWTDLFVLWSLVILHFFVLPVVCLS